MIKYNPHINNILRKPSTNKEGLRLDKSERLTSLSDKHWENFLKSLKQEDFRLYPDSSKLIDKLAKFHGVLPENICLNFGSESSLKSLFELFLKPGGNVISTDPCFPMYNVYCQEYQAEFRQVKYDPTLNLSIHSLTDEIDENTNLIVLTNPNSPIGDIRNAYDFIQIPENIPIIIDEAYFEFTNKNQVNYIACSNIFIIKTFSKAFGGAGIRLGYTISNKENIELLKKIQPAFEITGPSLKYAEFLLDNYNEIVVPYINDVLEEKSKLIKLFVKKGYDIVDSNCNWIHINNQKNNLDTEFIFDKFNIIVKNRLILPHDNRDNWIRLSILPGFHKHKLFKEL